MLKLLRAILALIVLVVLVELAIDNRQLTTISFWPLPLSYELPVYAVFFIGLFLGVLAGGFVVWLNGHATRVERRRLKRTVGYVEQQERQRHQDEEAAIVDAARRRAEATPSAGSLPAPTRA